MLQKWVELADKLQESGYIKLAKKASQITKTASKVWHMEWFWDDDNYQKGWYDNMPPLYMEEGHWKILYQDKGKDYYFYGPHPYRLGSSKQDWSYSSEKRIDVAEFNQEIIADLNEELWSIKQSLGMEEGDEIFVNNPNGSGLRLMVVGNKLEKIGSVGPPLTKTSSESYNPFERQELDFPEGHPLHGMTEQEALLEMDKLSKADPEWRSNIFHENIVTPLQEVILDELIKKYEEFSGTTANPLLYPELFNRLLPIGDGTRVGHLLPLEPNSQPEVRVMDGPLAGMVLELSSHGEFLDIKFNLDGSPAQTPYGSGYEIWHRKAQNDPELAEELEVLIPSIDWSAPEVKWINPNYPILHINHGWKQANFTSPLSKKATEPEPLPELRIEVEVWDTFKGVGGLMGIPETYKRKLESYTFNDPYQAFQKARELAQPERIVEVNFWFQEIDEDGNNFSRLFVSENGGEFLEERFEKMEGAEEGFPTQVPYLGKFTSFSPPLSKVAASSDLYTSVWYRPHKEVPFIPDSTATFKSWHPDPHLAFAAAKQLLNDLGPGYDVLIYPRFIEAVEPPEGSTLLTKIHRYWVLYDNQNFEEIRKPLDIQFYHSIRGKDNWMLKAGFVEVPYLGDFSSIFSTSHLLPSISKTSTILGLSPTETIVTVRKADQETDSLNNMPLEEMQWFEDPHQAFAWATTQTQPGYVVIVGFWFDEITENGDRIHRYFVSWHDGPFEERVEKSELAGEAVQYLGKFASLKPPLYKNAKPDFSEI